MDKNQQHVIVSTAREKLKSDEWTIFQIKWLIKMTVNFVHHLLIGPARGVNLLEGSTHCSANHQTFFFTDLEDASQHRVTIHDLLKCFAIEVRVCRRFDSKTRLEMIDR